MKPRAKQPETLTGIVERITFHAADSGYTIARLQVPRHEDLVTIAGNFPNIQAGQTLKLTGNWREHPQYGPQFQVESYEESKPATLTGIEKYLGSGFIKGVGRKTAKRIVAHFGMDTLEVIESDLDRLYEVEGLGKQRVARIKAAWAAHKAVREVMVFLQSHAVSTVYAAKIFKKYGAQAIAAVTDNPYKLSEEIYGIGFKTADKIACNVGVSPWSKFRFEAGMTHLLSEAADAGHCYLPLPELAEKAVELLAIGETRAEPETIAAIRPRHGGWRQVGTGNPRWGRFDLLPPQFFLQRAELGAVVAATEPTGDRG